MILRNSNTKFGADSRVHPRVFYVEPVGGHRGMHYYDFELCQALQAVGVDVVLLTSDETEHVPIPGSLRVEFPFEKIYGNSPRAVRGLRYLRGLLKIARRMQTDSIQLGHFHFFHFPPLDYLYLRMLQLMGKRIVVTAHDVIPFDASPTDVRWIDRIYQHADGVVVHAKSNADSLLQRFAISDKDVYVVPMGPYLSFADENNLPASAAKQRLGLTQDDLAILFFGQIKKVKGLRYLLHSFREVACDFPTARLLIAGPEWKESFAGYAELIRDLGLEDRVTTRIEYVSDEEVGVYFSAADAVVLPYVEAYQSAVLYMAHSFSKPVVASAVGGLAEVIEHEKTGLLVPPTDVGELTTALTRVLRDRQAAANMGVEGRLLVEKRFCWARIAEQVAAVYIEVVQRAN